MGTESATTELDCHLLTRQWRDTREGLELTFWARSALGPVRACLRAEQAVFFAERDADTARLPVLPHSRREVALQTLAGAPVAAFYFSTQRGLIEAREALKGGCVPVYESDIKPSDRYLMERFITSAFRLRGDAVRKEGWLDFENPSVKRAEFRAELRCVSLDIETEGMRGELYSIAVSGPGLARVFMVSEEPIAAEAYDMECFPDEKALLVGFFAWLKAWDPDLILGWNVVAFDLDFLERRCEALGLPFDLGRGAERSTVLRPQGSAGTHVARLPGRVVLDGIDTLRAAFWSFESFELEAVAQALLGRGKKLEEGSDKIAQIRHLFRHDKRQLAAYNLEDCRLVTEIFAHARLIDFAVRRAELTGLPMDRFGGSVASFDNLYLPRLHRRGRVAPDVGDVAPGPGSPGGYVIDSKPGLYDNVLLLDFKSLYPSIIRTFKVDPFGLHVPGEDPVPGFLGAAFSREGAILPELVEELWGVRDEAKKRGDAPLSQAVKILMNSFYGVLAAEGCRFYDARLATSITKRGHEIIQRSQAYLEGRGLTVIYGDTDSLFVLLGDGVSETRAREEGEALAQALNRWWRDELARRFDLESFLELQFEAHFLRFLMPTVRGEKTGSKKRYAGLVRDANGDYEVAFKGLESVRTDWTALARRFQRELYRRVFLEEPFEDYVRGTLTELMAGHLDEELVYRKRIRRALDDYTKNVPPHVQAARKLENPGRWIRYVITTNGPEPVVAAIPKPDYEHYRERQLAPVADGILPFLDTSFDAITNAQLSIF